MARLEVPQVDLECSGHSRRSSVSVSFSDADKGSCYSQFCSTADGSNQDDYRYPHGSESADSVSIEIGDDESKGHLGETERDCRICHLSLVSCGNEYGVAIELGCSCKDDLAAAHKHCAETWFKIKGNKKYHTGARVLPSATPYVEELELETSDEGTYHSTAVLTLDL
ncbi:uncharacterized protein LOC129877345 isoform X2 [Solanum dulcamara]|uniref:uncharacterized protein LOC129877345 isoform X2 n=1 Tax=Solanum dulcamara TaxID=45834 RepID=UPI0024856125|nr:uncharacterized protein LOC129877345 isoform X2 [Solanum dulcamara]